MTAHVLASAANTPFSQAPLWYITRSTGVVAFVLLSLTVAFGVAATQRALASPHWPRFATQALHRNISLLHFLKTGTEAKGSFGTWLALGATVVVGGAVALRVLTSDEQQPRPVGSIVR